MFSSKLSNCLPRHVIHEVKNHYSSGMPRAPGLQHAIALIQKTFDRNQLAYLDSNLGKLHGEVSDELRGLYNDTSADIHVLEKWEAGEILRLLNALPGFRRQFNIEHAMSGGKGRALLPIPFRDFLMDALHTHIKNSRLDVESGFPLIAFMAEDGALSEFGFGSSLEKFRRRDGSGLSSPHARLSLDDLLFLTYYTHSQSGLFNIVTPVGRLHMYGHHNFRRAIFPLYGSIRESVEQLSRDPRFGVEGRFYKGLNLRINRWAETALWNNIWRDRFLAGLTNYGFGSPISAGSTLDASFANRPDYPYLAVFSGFRAADVSLLNGGECILPESQTRNVVMTGFSVTEILSQRSGKDEGIATVEFMRRN